MMPPLRRGCEAAYLHFGAVAPLRAPQLTVRGRPCSRQPRRIVIDPRLETPSSARLLAGGDAWILTLAAPDGDVAARAERVAALRARGARVLVVPPMAASGSPG